MKIKHGMILAAGLGKRMQPLTLKIPKPLLEIEGVTLLERALNLLISNGVEEVSINIHHLSHQIREYLSKAKHKANIEISSEEDLLLDTGGGAEKATKNFKENPFFIINPDTLCLDIDLVREKLENAVLEIPLGVKATLSQPIVNISRLLRLNVGETLEIPISDKLDVYVEDIKMFNVSIE